jgi:hypothetical protein
VFQKIQERATLGVISDTRQGSPYLLLCSLSGGCGEPVVTPPADVAVQVYGISNVTLVPSRGNRVMGNVMVTVVQTETGDLAGDVRVSGHWTVDGEASPTYPDQGFTDSGGVQFGQAWITSNRMHNVTSMQFCVTQLSGEGRNGVSVATRSNSGSYTDNLGKHPSGSFTYVVCNAGSDPAGARLLAGSRLGCNRSAFAP